MVRGVSVLRGSWAEGKIFRTSYDIYVRSVLESLLGRLAYSSRSLSRVPLISESINHESVIFIMINENQSSFLFVCFPSSIHQNKNKA